MKNIKSILPVDNINPQQAVTTLSRRESGSLIVLFSVMLVILLGVVIYLAINSNPQCGEEKAALRQDNAVLQKRIMFLEQNRDYEAQQKNIYRDSLERYRLFQHFNTSSDSKQIILETKKDAAQ